jgi:hypothetical protein
MLWHNKETGISAADIMLYLARLAGVAQRRAPDVARALLARSEAVEAALELASPTPRSTPPRNSQPNLSQPR